MIRRILSAATVSTLAVSVVACSAAPSSEGELAGSSELTHRPTCTEPFTVPVASNDDGELRGGPRVIWSCDSLAAPPTPVPGYSGGTISSCAPASPVPRPPGLAGCTPGWGIGTIDQYSSVFLCPTGTVLPPPMRTSPGHGTSYAWFGSPANGCFGDSLDSSYAYVLRTDYSGGAPGNCGGSCGHF